MNRSLLTSVSVFPAIFVLGSIVSCKNRSFNGDGSVQSSQDKPTCTSPERLCVATCPNDGGLVDQKCTTEEGCNATNWTGRVVRCPMKFTWEAAGERNSSQGAETQRDHVNLLCEWKATSNGANLDKKVLFVGVGEPTADYTVYMRDINHNSNDAVTDYSGKVPKGSIKYSITRDLNALKYIVFPFERMTGGNPPSIYSFSFNLSESMSGAGTARKWTMVMTLLKVQKGDAPAEEKNLKTSPIDCVVTTKSAL